MVSHKHLNLKKLLAGEPQTSRVLAETIKNHKGLAFIILIYYKNRLLPLWSLSLYNLINAALALIQM